MWSVLSIQVLALAFKLVTGACQTNAVCVHGICERESLQRLLVGLILSLEEERGGRRACQTQILNFVGTIACVIGKRSKPSAELNRNFVLLRMV